MLSLDSENTEIAQRHVQQSIPDDQRQMATKARLEFQQANYASCLQTLRKLHSLRPDDIKVFHNMSIVEYYISKCCETATFYDNLQAISRAAHIDEDFDLIDDVDQSVVFYNKAVILFHLQKYEAALELLDKVFQYVEPLEETLALKICFLLIELYLTLNQPRKALSVASFVECTSFPGSNKGNSCKSVKDTSDITKAKLVQYRARCHVMMKSFKQCKREVKALMALRSQDPQIAGLFIKSRLEMFRSNFKKAVRIITSAQYPKNPWEYFLETGDSLQILSLNNLACIHHMIGKNALGQHYLYAAIELLKSEQNSLKISGKVFPSNQPIFTLRGDLLYRLVYNLGVMLFQNKNYKEAFQSFTQAAHLFNRDPVLWLRIAECIINFFENSKGHIHSKIKDMSVVKHFIGAGIYRKAILNSNSEKPHVRSISKTTPVVGLTMEYAMHVLKIAYGCLPKEGETVDSKSHNLSSNVPQAEDHETFNVRVAVHTVIKEEEVQKLRNHILCNCAYVSLRVGDALAAHMYAMNVLAQPKISGLHEFLARSYAAEALVSLDKISDAIEHLNPDVITDISNIYSEEVFAKQAKFASNTDLLPSLSDVKAFTQYNLALVYTFRGEWIRACNTLIKIDENSSAPVQDLKAYIDLCRGSTGAAKEYLKQCFPANLN